MASDLLSIATSGTKAARLALDVTAQNIANASSEGYVRRSLRLEELASSGGFGRIGDVSLSGVRLGAVVRNADLFRQAEVRRTGADAARGDAEVAGLENIQTAVEQSNVCETNCLLFANNHMVEHLQPKRAGGRDQILCQHPV